MHSDIFIELPVRKLFFRCAAPAVVTAVFGAMYSVIANMEAQGLESDVAVGDCGGGPVVFCVATSAIVIPMIVYWIQNKRGKVGHVVTLHGDEKTFEETFPPLNKTDQ